MKIDYHYPELRLWVTLWVEKPDRFDGLWSDRKQKLKEDIRLAATDALRPGGVYDSAGDAGSEEERAAFDKATVGTPPLNEQEPAIAPPSDAHARKEAEPVRMPDGEDGHIGE